MIEHDYRIVEVRPGVFGLDCCCGLTVPILIGAPMPKARAVVHLRAMHDTLIGDGVDGASRPEWKAVVQPREAA